MCCFLEVVLWLQSRYLHDVVLLLRLSRLIECTSAYKPPRGKGPLQTLQFQLLDDGLPNLQDIVCAFATDQQSPDQNEQPIHNADRTLSQVVCARS